MLLYYMKLMELINFAVNLFFIFIIQTKLIPHLAYILESKVFISLPYYCCVHKYHIDIYLRVFVKKFIIN